MSLPAIPRRGLEAALRAWTGRGSLLEALSAPVATEPERDWTAEDVLRRARRILWEDLEALFTVWPDRQSTWTDALPVRRDRDAVDLPFPSSSTRWAKARVRGMPMREFPTARVRRSVDPETLAILHWTLAEVALLRAAAADPLTATALVARERVDVALELLDGAVPPTGPPTAVEIRGVHGLGKPWRALASVALRLRLLYDPAATTELAMRLLAPDEQYAWRLFHLGVLGELLLGLTATGAQITSLRPLGASSPGPAFRVLNHAEAWDLWFEAAGAWTAYDVEEPYAGFAKAVRGVGQPLGADLMLCRIGRGALVIECKYSSDPAYVARDGYHQIATYVLEAIDLTGSSDVNGYVVGPSDVVSERREVMAGGVSLGITHPEDLDIVVEALFTPTDDP